MVHLFTHLNLCTLVSESKSEFQKYTRPLFSSVDLGPDQTSCEISGQRCCPSVVETPSRNIIPYLEIWCNLAPVSGWLTWIRGNFYIILTNSTYLRHARAGHLKILAVIVFFCLSFYERWTVTKLLAIFTHICVNMQCENLINIKLILIWYNLKQRSA